MGKPFLSDVLVSGAGVKLDNAQYYQAKDSGGTYLNVAGVNASNVVEIGASGKVLNLIGSGVGYGITSSLLGLVHVKGGASQLVLEGTSADAQIRFKNTTTSDTYIDASAAKLQFYINNSGAPTVTMLDGQVGVGITSGFLALVHIKGTAEHICIEGTGTAAAIRFKNTSNSVTYIGSYSNTLAFYVNNSGVPTVTMLDGLVGVGTTSPLTTLDAVLAGGPVINLCGHNDASALSTDVLLGEIRGDSSYNNARSAGHSAASIQFRTDPSTWYLGYISFRTNSSDATSNAAVERMRLTSGGTLRMTSFSLGTLTTGVADTNDKFWFAGDGNGGYYMHWNTSIGKMEWVTDGNTILTIGLGVIGIGPFTSTGHQLQLQADDAYKPTSSTWTIVSDATAKNDVQPYERGLDVLRKLTPRQFRFNGLYATTPGAHGISLVAQEAAEHAPELFRWHEPPVSSARMAGAHGRTVAVPAQTVEPHWTMNLHAMFFLLLNAVKELDSRLAKLEGAA